MDIVLDRQAQKQLRRTPREIIRKLRDWVVTVTQQGLQEVARIPGYHDEPLRGKRKDQRSIRLSRLWRAIYQRNPARILIQEVTPHDYRVTAGAVVDALPYLNSLLGDEAAASEAQMDKEQTREIVATLIRSGRRDLARKYAASRGRAQASVTAAAQLDPALKPVAKKIATLVVREGQRYVTEALRKALNQVVYGNDNMPLPEAGLDKAVEKMAGGKGDDLDLVNIGGEEMYRYEAKTKAANMLYEHVLDAIKNTKLSPSSIKV